MHAGAQRLVRGEEKLNGFANRFLFALSGRQGMRGVFRCGLGLILHQVDAFNLEGQNIGHGDDCARTHDARERLCAG